MRAAVFYATREGQSQRVAEFIAGRIRASHSDVDIFNVKDVRPPIDWRAYGTVFVVASVHAGHHEREIVRFARTHRLELARLNASFLSLTLSQAGAEDPAAPPIKREESAADAQRMVDAFVEDTGWRPAYALPVAGALAYSKYGFFIKLIMKRIARKAGAPTDTSRDYEFTDWAAIDRFVSDRVGLSKAS